MVMNVLLMTRHLTCMGMGLKQGRGVLSSPRTLHGGVHCLTRVTRVTTVAHVGSTA